MYTRQKLRKLRFPHDFLGLSATVCTFRCDFTEWGGYLYAAVDTQLIDR